MKRSLTNSVLLVVVLLIIPTAVSAQEFRNMELNLFIAGSAYTKNRYELTIPQISTPIPAKFRLDDTLRGGVRFNVNTTRHWGEEFFFSYEPNNANFTFQSYDIRIMNVGMNAMYYLNEEETRKTRPFLSIGVGGAIYQPTAEARAAARDPLRGNLPGFESSAEFALNYGVGFKRSLGQAVGFRMDVRGFVSRNPSFGLPRSSSNPNVVTFPANGAIHNLEVSAGFIFKFKN